ncbi:MAG: peptidase M48, partial [Lysobacterales bacterium]
MNFFAHQDQARRQTRRMLALFALAVATIVVAIDGVLLLAFGSNGAHATPWAGILALSAFVVLMIGLGSLYRIATLRGGGAVVARELGGVPVPGDTGNFA